MRIADILLKGFRNHRESRAVFGPGINGLLGMNGAGKTNILEAISYLSLTKSFYAAADSTVLRIGDDKFVVDGAIIADTGGEHRVVVTYAPGVKDVRINNVPADNFASVIGRFPIVILSPENSSVTFGGPAERRKFTDLLLSQVSKAYLVDLLEYRQVLRQRNRLLGDMRRAGRMSTTELLPWNRALVTIGSRIIARRSGFLSEFTGYVAQAYADLVANHEVPALEYATVAPGVEGRGEGEIASLMEHSLEERGAEELRRGVSLVGPHRDDILLRLNGMSVQQYASQGQHKTLLVALKAAEFFYLKERVNESPILLLDDLFSELDERRCARILDLVGRLGQTIITATDEGVFHGAVRWGDDNRRFIVEQGTIRRA